MGALLGAILGALTGFCSGLLSEKFRGRLDAIRAELARLDDLHDEAGGVLYDVNAGHEVSPAALQRVDRIRTRLGQNLRRIGYDSAGWLRIEAGLEQFQQSWAHIEEAALGGAHPVPLEPLETSVQNLRRIIDNASDQFPTWRLMGFR